jgi:predicted dehydrogenase
MMHPIKTAICAYGLSGQIFHAPYIAHHEGFELYKILQRQSNSAQKDYPNTVISKTYDDLLHDDAIELIIVNTPNHLHYEMTKQALQAGKHVLVEKPFTQTITQAEELITLAEAQHLVLYVYQNRRWDSDFQTVKKVLEGNLLGRLVYYEANWDRYRNFVKPNTWKEAAEGGTGMLYDLGSHMIDQIITLFGLPETVNAQLRINRTDGKVVDFFSLQLHYPQLEVAVGGSYLAREARPRFLLQGELGSFVKYGLDPQEDRIKAGWQIHHPEIGVEPDKTWGTLHTALNGLTFKGTISSEIGNYISLFEDLHQAIRMQKTPYVQPLQALHTMRIIEAAIKSNATQNRIKL